MSTEAKRQGNKRYLEKLDEFRIRVQQGRKAEIQAFAASKGKSLNAYVVDLIQKDMEKDKA